MSSNSFLKPTILFVVAFLVPFHMGVNRSLAYGNESTSRNNAEPKSESDSKPSESKNRKEQLEQLRKRFLSYGKMEKEVGSVFRTHPIERKFPVKIDVPWYLFPRLFGDLDYAVQKSVQYAKTKYKITYVEKAGYYDAFDGYKTYAHIYPIYRNKKGTHHVYYVSGRYKHRSYLTLRGEMVVDVRFAPDPKNLQHTIFRIEIYVRITNPFVRKLTKTLMKSEHFNEFSDKLIDDSIRRIRRVGLKVGKGLHRERHLDGRQGTPKN